MKIVSFVVRLHCEACDGTGIVVRVENGQQDTCTHCAGRGTVGGVVDFASFAKLIEGFAKLIEGLVRL